MMKQFPDVKSLHVYLQDWKTIKARHVKMQLSYPADHFTMADALKELLK